MSWVDTRTDPAPRSVDRRRPTPRAASACLRRARRNSVTSMRQRPCAAPSSSSIEPWNSSLPVIQDGDPVADRLDVAEQVAGEQHGGVLPHRPDEVEDLAPTERVERGGRLVEHQQAGPGDHRGGQAEPLQHAAGVAARASGVPRRRGRPGPAPRGPGPRRHRHVVSRSASSTTSRPVSQGSNRGVSGSERDLVAGHVDAEIPPEVWRAAPASRPRRVDFPAPLGPTSPVTLPVGHLEVDSVESSGAGPYVLVSSEWSGSCGTPGCSAPRPDQQIDDPAGRDREQDDDHPGPAGQVTRRPAAGCRSGTRPRRPARRRISGASAANSDPFIDLLDG